MKRANVSDIVPQSLVSDITDEDRAAYAKEKSLVEEHLEFIRAYQKKYEKEMRKSDPRYLTDFETFTSLILSLKK